MEIYSLNRQRIIHLNNGNGDHFKVDLKDEEASAFRAKSRKKADHKKL